MPTLPTAAKEQKVQKIRNAEYYDFQNVQDTLYAQSRDNKVFKKLMPIILTEENIMLAYRNIKKNTGSHTPGVDGKTIYDLSKWQEKSLITYIRTRLLLRQLNNRIQSSLYFAKEGWSKYAFT